MFFFIFPSPPQTKLAAISSLLRAKYAFSSNPHLLPKNYAGDPLQDLISLNTQIAKCMRNGFTEQAQKLFDESPDKNTITWNSMIRGYFQNDNFDQAVYLFDQMPNRDLFSYNTMISGLMQYGDVKGANLIFDRMPVRDLVSWNSMAVGYVRNALMSDAMLLFDEMPVRNVISWNIVVSGLVNLGYLDIAEQLFEEMPVRDVASWTVMILGLANQGRISEARNMFDEMPDRDTRACNTMLCAYINNDGIAISQGLFVKMPHKDLDSWSILIDGFVGSGRLAEAWRCFTEMPKKSTRAWNSILLGFIKDGCVEEAHAVFEKTPFRDTVSWTNVIVGYFELGEYLIAYKLFELTPEKDETLWNATIFGLGENDLGEDGLKLFMQMKGAEYLSPDHATFTTVLNICSILPSLDFGKLTHGLVIKMGFDSFVAVGNAILTMYARCGSISLAFTGFTCVRNPDIISWNSIICGLSHHGRAREALQLFKRMRLTNTKPDEVTFVGVLSACSHAGLIKEGLNYFSFMRYKCFIKPTCEHYTCIVDLLGRYGHVEEAVNFIKQMRADGVEPSGSVWGALLGACRTYGNVEVGKMVGEKVLEMEPQNAGAYMILAEIYLISGRTRDAERIWGLMKERGVKKQPGCSWIEVKNSVHVFLAGDGSHPEINGIYDILSLLCVDMEIDQYTGNSYPMLE